MAGWMEVTGSPDGPPQMVGDNIGDSVPGLWAALGVVLALETRRKTGVGQHVDMAMYDCMTAHTTSSMPFYQATGRTTGRARGEHDQRPDHPASKGRLRGPGGRNRVGKVDRSVATGGAERTWPATPDTWAR